MHLGTPQPKPRPYALVKRERQAARQAKDRIENRKVHLRCEGRCEVTVSETDNYGEFKSCCNHRAVGDPHHLISGSGRRNVGNSILAEWKLAACRECHRLITEHILVPEDPRANAQHVLYRRIR